jgi:purine catabolism regulator
MLTNFEELGIYRLLFQVPDAGELRSFAEQVLGSLLAYDRRHEADLVRTLGAYLRHHGSLQSAARELVVHVNTVSYRLQRIEEIAGLKLGDAEDRLTAQVALKILAGLEPA